MTKKCECEGAEFLYILKEFSKGIKKSYDKTVAIKCDECGKVWRVSRKEGIIQ